MPGPKTNERPGTRATLRSFPMSASKARVVLNLIRGEDVATARDILSGTTREAADVSLKVLNSAISNAVNNDGVSADELFVAAAFADEGITMKRFSPRARGRAGRINKRTCHITIIVARMDEDRLEIVRTARSAQAVASRSRRVASSRRRSDASPTQSESTPTSNETSDLVVGDQSEVLDVESDVEVIDEDVHSEVDEAASDDVAEDLDGAEPAESADSDATEETK